MPLSSKPPHRRTSQCCSSTGKPTPAAQPFLASAIEHVPIAVPQPYANNARQHSEAQVGKLAAMIAAVGFLVPLILDNEDRIIAGHARWAAARRLDLVTVPVIRVSHLSEAQVRAYRVADNRLAELSAWDEATLAIELKGLATLEIELDLDLLDLTGFETAEIDLRIADGDTGEHRSDDADEVPAPMPAVSRHGDLWRLGRHRLYCGSSLDPDSYRRLLGDELVHVVWSDPPYNVPISGHVSGLGKARHREFAMASGEMSEHEFVAFLATYLRLAKEHSRPGSLHYVCMDALHGWEMLSAARQVGLGLKTTCTWAKTNAGMGSLYRQQTEFVHVFKNGGSEIAHLNNVQLGRFGRSRTTLWRYAGVNTFRAGRQDDLADHPTVKPWALVADALKDCSRRGEAVLDAFCGSGTTLIAAEKAGRVGRGIELDPVYVDVAIRRWQKLTGGSAVLDGSGRSFAEEARARAQSSSLEMRPAQSEVGEIGHDRAA